MSELALVTKMDADDLATHVDHARQGIERLLAASNAGDLNEIRRRAEASALYEKRAHNIDRERQFASVRLMAEAALGALSFDDPTLIPLADTRKQWRTLASAFERGRLMECCDENFSTKAVATAVRERGFTYADRKHLGMTGIHSREPVPWGTARSRAVENGIDLKKIPACKEALQQRRREKADAAVRMKKLHRRAARMERIENQRKLKILATERGGQIGVAYGFLRQFSRALHDSQSEFSRGARRELDDAFTNLHAIEDIFGRLLRTPDFDNEWALKRWREQEHKRAEKAAPSRQSTEEEAA